MQESNNSKTVAGYHVGGVIGIGTYGEVRYAHHATSGERVALKLIDLSRFSSDTSQLIMKEIKILRMIKHPHCIRIVQVKEQVPYCGTWCDACACTRFKRMNNGCCGNCGHGGADHSSEETRDVLIIIQELAAGGELFGLLMHCGAFPEEVARYYFRQLVDGLEHLHEQGIVHRDLKPENLVLDGSFALKIVDFGLASFCDDTTGVLHSGVGSQPYSAPEVFYTKELYNGGGYKGQAADIWSCAVILFVMLTGRPPFMRPLAKTYGQNMRRCKHFVNLMKGIGYEKMSTAAKEFMMRLFRVHPDDRLSIEAIKRDPWFNGPVPSRDVMAKMMEERAHKVWNAQDKSEMIQVLSKIRAEMTPINRLLSPSAYPTEAPSNDPFAGAETGISLLSLADCEEPVYRSIDIIPPTSNIHDMQQSFYDFDGNEHVMIKAVDMESWAQQEQHTPISLVPDTRHDNTSSTLTTTTTTTTTTTINKTTEQSSSDSSSTSSTHIPDGKTPDPSPCDSTSDLYHLDIFPQHSYTRMITTWTRERIIDVLSRRCMMISMTCHTQSHGICITGTYHGSHLILYIHLLTTRQHTLIDMHKIKGDMMAAYHFYSTVMYGAGMAIDEQTSVPHVPIMLETS